MEEAMWARLARLVRMQESRELRGELGPTGERFIKEAMYSTIGSLVMLGVRSMDVVGFINAARRQAEVAA